MKMNKMMWKLGVLLIMVTVLMNFTGAAARESSVEKDDPLILEFVQHYYEAVENKNEFALSRMVYMWNEDIRDALLEPNSSIEHRQIETWSLELDENDYAVFVRYSREDEKGRLVPDLKGIYLFENNAGRLMISPPSDEEHKVSQKLQEAMGRQEIQDLIAQVQADYQAALKAPEADTGYETEAPETEAAETEAAQTGVSETEYQDPRLEYIFPDSDQRYLSDDEIQHLSLQAMNYAKNEIYARRGRKFVSVELQEYFASKSWYKGTIEPAEFPESVFNDYERYNSIRINELEAARAGSELGYPLDTPGYNINAVGTASYAIKNGGNNAGQYTGDNGEVAAG